MRSIASALARVVAGLLAVASLWPVYIGVLWAMLLIFIAAQRPDPRVADGDPCCGYPDTWGEVTLGIAYGLLLAILAVLVLYVAITLAAFALRGGRAKLLRLRRLLASLLTVVAVSAAYTAFVFLAY